MILLAAAVAAAADVEIVADHLVLEGDTVVATGAVSVLRGADTLHTETLELRDGVAHLGAGTWNVPGVGTLGFDAAEVDLDTGRGVVTRGALTTPERGAWPVFEGERLTIEPDGTVVGERVRFLPCACPAPVPWSVSARRAELEPAREVRVRGAWLRVLNLPIVPVPRATVPLERRSGLLTPELGWGVQGVRAGWPLYLTLGRAADVTLTPEVQAARAVGGRAELRWATRDGGGQLDAAARHDWVDARPGPRVAVGLSAAETRDEVRFAAQGSVLSDLDQLADYGDQFLTRALPWTEARLLGAWGPVELTSRTAQARAPTRQDVVRIEVAEPTPTWGRRTIGTARASVAAQVDGTSAWDATPVPTRLEASVSAARPGLIGPLLATRQLEASGLGLITRSATWWSARTATTGTLALPLWRDTPHAFERLHPFVQAGLGTTHGQLTHLRALVRGGVAWRRVARTGIVDLSVDAGHDRGASARVVGQARSGPLFARLELAASGSPTELSWLSTAVIAITPDWGRLELGGIAATPDQVLQGNPWDPSALTQVWGTVETALPGPLRPIRLGVSARRDVPGVAWQTRAAWIAWEHPSGCVGLRVQGRLSQDRTLPDVDVTLKLDPFAR